MKILDWYILKKFLSAYIFVVLILVAVIMVIDITEKSDDFIEHKLTFDQISAFGGWLVGLIGPMTSKHTIARIGLKTAFPEAHDVQIKSWLKSQWINTGRTFGEFPLMHRLKVFDDQRVTLIGKDRLDSLIASKKPAVIVTGHFANWEVMAAVLTQSGLPVQITYRKINNPYIDKRVRSQRQAYGTKLLIQKSGARGARQILDALSKGESVALMNDQKFNQGLSLPFFGVDAMTAPGPTRLSLRSGAILQPISITRDKARFTMTFHDPIDLQKSGDDLADTEDGVRKINRFLEDRIRDNPDQWFWVHRRWPKEHYK